MNALPWCCSLSLQCVANTLQTLCVNGIWHSVPHGGNIYNYLYLMFSTILPSVPRTPRYPSTRRPFSIWYHYIFTSSVHPIRISHLYYFDLTTPLTSGKTKHKTPWYINFLDLSIDTNIVFNNLFYNTRFTATWNIPWPFISKISAQHS